MLFTNAKDIIIQLKKITELFFIANAIQNPGESFLE